MFTGAWNWKLLETWGLRYPSIFNPIPLWNEMIAEEQKRGQFCICVCLSVVQTMAHELVSNLFTRILLNFMQRFWPVCRHSPTTQINTDWPWPNDMTESDMHVVEMGMGEWDTMNLSCHHQNDCALRQAADWPLCCWRSMQSTCHDVDKALLFNFFTSLHKRWLGSRFNPASQFYWLTRYELSYDSSPKVWPSDHILYDYEIHFWYKSKLISLYTYSFKIRQMWAAFDGDLKMPPSPTSDTTSAAWTSCLYTDVFSMSRTVAFSFFEMPRNTTKNRTSKLMLPRRYCAGFLFIFCREHCLRAYCIIVGSLRAMTRLWRSWIPSMMLWASLCLSEDTAIRGVPFFFGATALGVLMLAGHLCLENCRFWKTPLQAVHTRKFSGVCCLGSFKFLCIMIAPSFSPATTFWLWMYLPLRRYNVICLSCCSFGRDRRWATSGSALWTDNICLGSLLWKGFSQKGHICRLVADLSGKKSQYFTKKNKSKC